ncbi:MAG: hypothetical protein AUJ04_06140 [Acidobacteria bacterium 13_1_40CM_3_55_6]|nr:MAG: hypothetical protein AUJ04_06140 [Acidobacteria bacterium 13_1_40CM_3_55_6]
MLGIGRPPFPSITVTFVSTSVSLADTTRWALVTDRANKVAHAAISKNREMTHFMIAPLLKQIRLSRSGTQCIE